MDAAVRHLLESCILLGNILRGHFFFSPRAWVVLLDLLFMFARGDPRIGSQHKPHSPPYEPCSRREQSDVMLLPAHLAPLPKLCQTSRGPREALPKAFSEGCHEARFSKSFATYLDRLSQHNT